MSHSPLELLRHILEEVDYLATTARDLAKESFLSDETLKRPFVRSIERHSLRLSAALMLASDPDAGCVSLWGALTGDPSPAEALSGDADVPAWMEAAPRLSIEIVEEGRDEADLAQKIDELTRAGSQYLWAVRRTGPLRVEVYDGSGVPRTFSVGRELRAEGVLRHAVPVEALFEDEAANAHVLCKGVAHGGRIGA